MGDRCADYDPLNHTVYVINGSDAVFMSGIDLVDGKVSSQLPLPRESGINAIQIRTMD